MIDETGLALSSNIANGTYTLASNPFSALWAFWAIASFMQVEP
jgi:hypothetical protein